MLAAQRGQRPEKLKQEMAKDGTLANLYVQMREQKAVDQILESADIEDVDVLRRAEAKTDESAASQTLSEDSTPAKAQAPADAGRGGRRKAEEKIAQEKGRVRRPSQGMNATRPSPRRSTPRGLNEDHGLAARVAPSYTPASYESQAASRAARKTSSPKSSRKAPTFWQDWGGRFLAVAVAGLVVVLLVKYRIQSNRQAAGEAMASLATARSDIEELQQLAMASEYYPPQESATRRRTLFNDANNDIGDAIHRSDDHKLQAEALVARGDLYWTLASLPMIPGSATQPSLMLKDPKELDSQRDRSIPDGDQQLFRPEIRHHRRAIRISGAGGEQGRF